MTVGPPEYADDMPLTDTQVDSIREDLRALSDTVSEILTTVVGHTARFDRIDREFAELKGEVAELKEEFTGVKGDVREILTLVRPKA